MAAAQATATQAMDKKRLSKADKRKTKKVPEAPAEEEAPVEQPVAQEDRKEEAKEAPTSDKVTGTNKIKKKTKANRLEEMQAAADEEEQEPRGVIYVGHIPEGFFEPQMRKFFTQFGKVLRLRISRSKKTARSKGYAFVEFEEESVAKIVAETMQGYLLFDKTLVCHLLPKEKQHKLLFKGCRRKFVNTTNLRRKKHIMKVNERPTVEVDGVKLPQHSVRQVAKRKRSDTKLAATLANLGVDYDLAGADEGAEEPATEAKPKSPKPVPKSPKAGAAEPAAAAVPKKKKKKLTA